MNLSRNITAAAAAVALALSGGCPYEPETPAEPNRVSVTGPCADRLHDLCEDLLLYFISHDKTLPGRLDDLKNTSPGRPSEAFVCPQSQKPYIYTPNGLPVAGRTGLLIMYDAEPCHNGMRWAIMAEPPRPGRPFDLRVICLPDKAIADHIDPNSPR